MPFSLYFRDVILIKVNSSWIINCTWWKSLIISRQHAIAKDRRAEKQDCLAAACTAYRGKKKHIRALKRAHQLVAYLMDLIRSDIHAVWMQKGECYNCIMAALVSVGERDHLCTRQHERTLHGFSCCCCCCCCCEVESLMRYAHREGSTSHGAHRPRLERAYRQRRTSAVRCGPEIEFSAAVERLLHGRQHHQTNPRCPVASVRFVRTEWSVSSLNRDPSSMPARAVRRTYWDVVEWLQSAIGRRSDKQSCVKDTSVVGL